MNEKSHCETKSHARSARKSLSSRGELNTREYKEKVMLDFVIACGDVQFIKKIAAGKDVSKAATIVAAAKKALSEWEKAPRISGCYDPYRTASEAVRDLMRHEKLRADGHGKKPR